MRPQATFSFFILFTTFFIFSLSSSLLQHCLNHLESVKGHFSLNLTKALRTDGRTDQPTNGQTEEASYTDARVHLEMIGIAKILQRVANPL